VAAAAAAAAATVLVIRVLIGVAAVADAEHLRADKHGPPRSTGQQLLTASLHADTDLSVVNQVTNDALTLFPFRRTISPGIFTLVSRCWVAFCRPVFKRSEWVK